jgi:hypothetical protein
MTTLTAQAFLPGFLYPSLAVAGAVATLIPIVIHILSKRPTRPIEWAAMKFLLAAYKKHKRRTQIEQLILLLNRILIALILGLALAGPIMSALGAFGGLGQRGRILYIVIDNAITSSAKDINGVARFDATKTAALALIDAMGPADRAALVATATPSQPIVATPVADPAALKREVQRLSPTAAAADMATALSHVMNDIQAGDPTKLPIFVALLSDFSHGAARPDRPLPPHLSELRELATLLMLEPAAGADNTQIVSILPDQRVVVPETPGAKPAVSWTIKLRRFAVDPERAADATVRLTAADTTPVLQPVRFEPGQTEASVRLPTPLDRQGLVPTYASLEPGAEGDDALDFDNTRHALVRIPQELSILVLARDPNGAAPGEVTLTPQRWLTTALAPDLDPRGSLLKVDTLDPAALNATELATANALMVLRPDLLTDPQWRAVGSWAEAGGLVWAFPPTGEAPSLWPQKLADTFGLDWEIALEPQALARALTLDSSARVTDEMRRLQAELDDLLRPVTFGRVLPIDPASLGAETDSLLVGANGVPLVIGAQTPNGRGRVLLSGLAISDRWSNLPAKPLFVALLHNTLRAAINQLQPLEEFEPGDQPRLDLTWAATPTLKGPGGADVLLVDTREQTATPDPTNEPVTPEAPAPGTPSPGPGAATPGMQPISPFAEPGLYASPTNALVVNVKPDAANTLAVDPTELEAWLKAVGEWHVLDAADPAGALRSQADLRDLSWPLLWALLALLLIETFLARYVSHASTNRRTEDALALNPVTRAAG